jgi:hypothetical protein
MLFVQMFRLGRATFAFEIDHVIVGNQVVLKDVMNAMSILEGA